MECVFQRECDKVLFVIEPGAPIGAQTKFVFFENNGRYLDANVNDKNGAKGNIILVYFVNCMQIVNVVFWGAGRYRSPCALEFWSLVDPTSKAKIEVCRQIKNADKLYGLPFLLQQQITL